MVGITWNQTFSVRSGKSSIERVVFHKLPPHETLFLESTHNVDINLIANNNFVRFQIWDFGGDISLNHDINFAGKRISTDLMFKNCSTLVYVIDAQEDYEDELPKLVETISVAYSINPLIHFEVFLVLSFACIKLFCVSLIFFKYVYSIKLMVI